MIYVLEIAFPTGNDVEFYGFELIEYYVKKFLLYFGDFPWTIRLLYGLIIVCIITMLVLFFLFFRKEVQSRRAEREYQSARGKLFDGFLKILDSQDKPDGSALEAACGVSLKEILSYKPKTLARLISETYMEQRRRTSTYVSNTDALCSLIGVKTYYEKNLTTSKKVLRTLEDLADMHIPVNEGLLAVYLNHYDLSLRHLARICLIGAYCSSPYRYLKEDLDDDLGLWYKMMLHRAFAYESAKEHAMPQFLVLAKDLRNEDSGAFLIMETAYWGTAAEKASLHEFFLSPHIKYRKAAIQAVALLGDTSQEQSAIDSYWQQPEEIMHEVLKMVRALNSGKHTSFFVDAYTKATSEQTREIALTCLYTYGKDGRRTFELLRNEFIKSNDDRTLMDQIDSAALLNQMRII